MENTFDPHQLITQLFDLTSYKHSSVFSECEYPWNVLPKIEPYIRNYLKNHSEKHAIINGNVWIGEDVSIGEGTIIQNGATIKGPTIIGKNCEIRSGAYIRGNVIVGDGCVIGHSCELKGSILLDNVQVAHFNYVGDSILGNKSHLAAGAITSNLKLDQSEVIISFQNAKIKTNLKKVGAFIGDKSQIGCHCIINPGIIIGKDSVIYPTALLRTHVGSNTIHKIHQTFTSVIKHKIASQ